MLQILCFSDVALKLSSSSQAERPQPVVCTGALNRSAMLNTRRRCENQTMATRRLGHTLDEVEEVRSRLALGRWDTASYDAMTRLTSLRRLIGTERGAELHRHVVVSAVAALQTSHRSTIVQLVDYSEEYRARAADSITERFTLQEALGWISGKRSSFGELVAHVAPCNSVADMLSWLTRILGLDLKVAIAAAVAPHHRAEPDEAPKVVDDVDALLSNVSEAFRLRHIFAHEAAPALEVDEQVCARLLDSIRLWMDGVNAVLWATIFKDEPLSPPEMRAHAWKEVGAARDELAHVMRKALRLERKTGSANWLRHNHHDWRHMVHEWRSNTYSRLDGTMWPAVAAADWATIIRARAKQLTDWVSSFEGVEA